MLHIVIGRAKSGRTTHAFQTAEKLAKQGKKSIYLVPEQFSYESERALFFDHQNFGGLCLALSFTSLCREIFMQNGGLAEKNLDPVGQNVLMSVAFDTVKDDLRIYGSQNLNGALLADLIQAKETCDQIGLASDQMEAVAALFDGDSLQDKLHDFALLFSTFDLLVQKNYGVQPNPILRAAATAHSYFAGKTLIIDNFPTFFAAQLQLLDVAVLACDDVYVYLTAEDIYDQSASPFYEGAAAARNLIRRARENGAEVANVVHLNGSYYREEQPMALENLLAGQQETSAKNTLILGAPDIYSEVTAIAVQMRRMVKNGARYRDMALIVRDVESYKTPVSQVFASYDIPYFLDTQKDIFTKPTMQFFTLVLNMAVKGFTAADLLQLLYIVRPDDPLAFDFENYLFLWKTDGAALKKSFVQNPRGFGKMEEEDALLLGRIEQLRNELVSPILKFKDVCKNSTGEQMVRALFDVYTFFDMNAVLESQIQKLQSMGEEAAARSQADQQNTAIALLDTLYTALQGVPMTLARFFDIYKLTADRAVYATVPQSIDQVTVASATGSIVGGVDIAFVAGISFGVFPAAQNSGGLFTAKDKDKLYRAGLTLSQNYAHSASQESACVYKAITCADKQVVLSYYDNNSDGSFIGCSEVIKQVKALEDVRFVRSEELSDLDLCIGDEAAFSLLCERANDPRMASLYAALDKGAQSRYQNAQGAPDCYRYSLTPRGADLLFPQNQTLSPSRLELYLQCPFAFFLQSGLGLRPLRQSEISPLETGTFVHYILEQVITRFRDSLRDIDEEQLQDAVTQAAADYVKNGFGEQNLTASQKALLARITQNSRLLMTRIWHELKQSEFTPAHFELKIGHGGIDPMVVTTPQGRKLSVIGTIDRVDLCQIGDETFVRVVDYKTGAKQFSLEDVYEGRSMQMLIYLFTLKQAGFGREAGVLYMPSFVGFGDTGEDGEVDLQANGLLLHDTRVLTAMEKDLDGKYIFVKEKNGKLTGEKYLATPAQFELLHRHTQNVLGNVADSLGSGQIDASPIKTGQYPHCRFCDFKTVCGREDNDPCRLPKKFEKGQTIYDLLSEEENS